MEVVATTKYLRMPASKARPFARRLHDIPVEAALRIATMSHAKAAAAIHKTLKSAIANAQNNAKLAVENLRVKDAIVDEGPRGGRFWPRSRGMVRPITRRMCHVKIVLTDGQPGEADAAGSESAQKT